MPHLEAVVGSGKLAGDGPMCKQVEEMLKKRYGIRHVLLTTSCTHALEMAVLLLDLQPGDEVILPSFTFVSTANAIIRGGGTPVFCEIDPMTLTIDPNDVAGRITSRTKAVIPVHYAGIAADMDAVIAITRSRNIRVIEDAAQGVDATYKGKFLGGLGDAGAFSFHETKNIISGEGGAFLTDNESLARRAEIIREKGTNRANFLRGEIDKYTWVEHGSSYILSDLLAAVLRFQLEIVDEIQQKRSAIFKRYRAGLSDLERRERVRLPVVPPHCTSNHHIFYMLLRDENDRNTVMRRLKERGVQASFHYIPLHSAPYAERFATHGRFSLPVTERIASTLLRLPLYPALVDEEVDYVIEQVREVL